MQQNINPCYNVQPQQLPVQGPNAVNINIIQPQAFADGANAYCGKNNCCSLYGANQNGIPVYPMNYNNLIQNPINQPIVQPYQGMVPQYQQYPANAMPYNTQVQQPQNGLNNNANAYGETNLIEKTSSSNTSEPLARKTENKEGKHKTITLLTDDYIKSMENYLNDSNPKVRLIAAKELMERFKEDNSRVNHPSLVPLLNKALRDTSPSVKFLALTTLQLGYSVGDSETVEILKEIQNSDKDKLGEDKLLASEILLKLSAPKIQEVK